MRANRPTGVLDASDPSARAPTAAARGELRRSAALAQVALAEPGTSADLAGAHLALAIVAREQDRLDDARREVDAAIGLAERDDLTGIVTLARLEAALVASSGGQHLEAIGRIVDVDRRLAATGPEALLRPLVDAVDALVHLAAGDVDRAEVLIDRLPASSITTLLGARVSLARGRVEAALAAAERVLREGPLDLRRRIEALGLASRAEAARGAHEAARARLAELAALARPEGHVRAFRDLGLDPSVGLPDEPAMSKQPRWSPLSGREQQVLRLLVDRRDNREIADAMYISVNTVKTHLQSIYRKLGVGSRRQAVERAIDLGVLRSPAVGESAGRPCPHCGPEAPCPHDPSPPRARSTTSPGSPRASC